MFEYLNGTVESVTPSYIALDVSGVGYKVLVANPYRYEKKQTAKIYIEQIVRENEQTLYGFVDLDEKNLFNKLISVSGIGPKSALAILAGNDNQGVLKAIEDGDAGYLVKFPGIGKKTAQQIILDLQGKLDFSDNGEVATAPVDNQDYQDGIDALLSLGYSQREVDKIKSELKVSDAKTADEYLRIGLKLLTN